MDASIEALTIFIFLIPGFVSSLLLNTVIVRKEKDTLSKIIEALVFSLIIYACVTAISGESPVFLNVTENDDKTKTYFITFNASFLIPLIAISVLLSMILGLLSTTDVHMKILRKLRITDKTARETVWLDVFTEQKRYVIVNLSDGRRVFGWPMYYSNEQEDGFLYLYNAAWVQGSSYIDLNIHGLFLVKKGNIDSIEFTWLDQETAREREEADGREKTDNP